jgi:hypothetical protein
MNTHTRYPTAGLSPADTLLSHMNEIEEYFDARQDVNWEGDGPNAEMRLLTETRAAIELIKDLIDRCASERADHEATIKHMNQCFRWLEELR